MMEKHIAEMTALARFLEKYSFPQTGPADEEAIACLKQREVFVDGYEVVLNFNRCRYADVTLETLQLFGRDVTFLPFTLLVKLACLFLGTKELSLIEIAHAKRGGQDEDDLRKLYVWSVYYSDSGHPITNPFVNHDEPCVYGGLRYWRIERNQVRLL